MAGKPQEQESVRRKQNSTNRNIEELESRSTCIGSWVSAFPFIDHSLEFGSAPDVIKVFVILSFWDIFFIKVGESDGLFQSFYGLRLIILQ